VSQEITVQHPQQRGALAAMASRLNVEPGALMRSLQQTAFKNSSNEEMLALVVVANQYGLNPFLKQIYAFPAKGGGIVPMVSIDGWLSIVNQHPDFDGVEFEYGDDKDGKPASVTCIMHHKRRAHPIKVTEFFSECERPTEPWKKSPRRMLRHKAIIQCGRVAFSLGGIFDEDEAKDQTFIDVPMVQNEEAPAPRVSKATKLAQQIKEQQPEKREEAHTQSPDDQAAADAQAAVDAVDEQAQAPHGQDAPPPPKTFANYEALKLVAVDLAMARQWDEQKLYKWLADKAALLGKKGKESTITPDTLARWWIELEAKESL